MFVVVPLRGELNLWEGQPVYKSVPLLTGG